MKDRIKFRRYSDAELNRLLGVVVAIKTPSGGELKALGQLVLSRGAYVVGTVSFCTEAVLAVKGARGLLPVMVLA